MARTSGRYLRPVHFLGFFPIPVADPAFPFIERNAPGKEGAGSCIIRPPLSASGRIPPPGDYSEARESRPWSFIPNRNPGNELPDTGLRLFYCRRLDCRTFRVSYSLGSGSSVTSPIPRAFSWSMSSAFLPTTRMTMSSGRSALFPIASTLSASTFRILGR